MPEPSASSTTSPSGTQSDPPAKGSKARSRSKGKDLLAIKRRCVSTACVACRKRKSKCDGNLPRCAACSSVYGTECVYDPNSDHRRKGVYKKDIDSLKTRNSTLQTLIEGILNYPDDEVLELVRQIRSCESLDDVAENILRRDAKIAEEEEEAQAEADAEPVGATPRFETELSGKMGELRLENGSFHFVGGTSNLIYLDDVKDDSQENLYEQRYANQHDAIVSWTTVTDDPKLVVHLMNMYFTWHYTYFTTLPKSAFLKQFLRGRPIQESRKPGEYCSSLLVNVMLALGCHFTSWPSARADPDDSATAGDHFFREAKRIMHENNEYEHPRLPTVQAFALMSVREAGCGREARGWVYSGMSFRMAGDLGLNVDAGSAAFDEREVDARRITFWGCFLFDKCWSNYLGRPPQLPRSNITVPKFEVFPVEEADNWSPWTDSGVDSTNAQPCRTRAVALQISALCEISNDLLLAFYHPSTAEKPLGKQTELKKLSDLHTRLEAWRKNLPREMEAREGQLPSILVMHMFFQLLFIHLFRPFLKYTSASSPLPATVSPRKMCTGAASAISKLLRLYRRTYGLRQICNIAVYIAHSACTIHLLNLPDKDARRDITYGLKHLSEIAEGWLCARRTLGILGTQVRRWKIELPEEAVIVLQQTDAKYGGQKMAEQPSPNSSVASTGPMPPLPSSAPLSYMPSPAEPSLQQFVPALPPPSSSAMAATGAPAAPQYSAAFPQIDYLVTQPPQQQQRRQTYKPIGQPGDQASEQRRESLSRLFGGIDSLFDDSRDWWLRDQSAIFDSWNRQDAAAAAAAVAAPPSFASVQLDSSSGPGSTDSGNSATRPAAGLDYMNFGFGQLGQAPVQMQSYGTDYVDGNAY